jgi:plasmid stability protein
VRKTIRYLPQGFKERLERAAKHSGKTEAAIVREGIELAVRVQEPPKPRSGRFDSGDPHFGESVEELLQDFGKT